MHVFQHACLSLDPQKLFSEAAPIESISNINALHGKYDHLLSSAELSRVAGNGRTPGEGYGFIDSGSKSVIRAQDEESDTVAHHVKLIGVNDSESDAYRTTEGELACPNESLIILPYRWLKLFFSTTEYENGWILKIKKPAENSSLSNLMISFGLALPTQVLHDKFLRENIQKEEAIVKHAENPTRYLKLKVSTSGASKFLKICSI